MQWWKRLFGRQGDTACGLSTPGKSDARVWLERASARPYVWRDLGELALPSREIFVGDPTWGDNYHLTHTGAVDVPALTVWVLASPPTDSPYLSHVNGLLWLEASGDTPVAVGTYLTFGVDAACLGLGDLAAGRAFAELTHLELDAGRGDSFEWLLPHIQAHPHYARWLTIPPAGLPMFVASTGNDGGFGAAWLHGENGALAGILIDIEGRAGDSRLLDTLLPPMSAA